MITPTELPSKHTPITYTDIGNALLLAWEVSGTQPTRAAVQLAAAQVGVEANGGRACQNYNISGIKAKAGGKYCWQYFRTTEYYTDAQLVDAQRKGPGLVAVLSSSDGKTKVSLAPPHPYCCFRAYPELISESAVRDRDRVRSAMVDHMMTLALQFPHGLAGLLTGKAEHFAHGLKADRYYTAPEDRYAYGLQWRLKEVEVALPDSWSGWGDVA